MEILTAILVLGGLGMAFGIGLAIASKKLSVHVDPKLEEVHHLLPGSNCGACGNAGCFGFAESLLSGKSNLNACRVCSFEIKEKLAKIMGTSVEKQAKKVATLHCHGGIRVKDKYLYSGLKDCVSANQFLKGQKECTFACLGFGTCVLACPFEAITMSEDNLPVVDISKCRACNKCVLACPKKLFSLISVTNPVYVACSSHDSGREVKDVCPVGCIACKLCEKACKFDAIQVTDNLAVIDYHKCTSCEACVKVCPAKTIRVRR
ncbi:MAG: RnfABCDGE type electron transport complex subunit B [Candidatus Omnitrophica bacterium]|nr:RnfABCDGE type electron transport complex subunit B [Candidatus Omnitrophota bacterium]